MLLRNTFLPERPLSDYVPLFLHVDDKTIVMNDGSVFCMLELEGQQWETADKEVLVARWQRRNATLTQLHNEDLILTFYDCRGESDPSCYPRGEFASGISEAIDTAYREKLFADMTMYSQTLYIGFQLRPRRYAGEYVGKKLARARKRPVEIPPDQRVETLHRLVEYAKFELADYKPRSLGRVIRDDMVFCEISEALVYALTGTRRPVGVTTGAIGQSLFSEDVFIGSLSETIEFRLPHTSTYGAMLGFRKYTHRAPPWLMKKLLGANYRYTLFNSFRYVPTYEADTLMSRKASHMLAGKDPAISQREALVKARDNLQNADYAMGHHSASLLVFASDRQELKAVTTAAWSDLTSTGASIARESVGLEGAWAGMIPGRSQEHPRKGACNTKNLASLASLHAHPRGAGRGYWGEPLLLLRTMGGTPYRYHPHVGDVGNTFFCGMTGGGKTTLATMVMLQSERLGSQVIAFDKDRGMKIAVYALGGVYHELGIPTGLAPLKALTDDPDDMVFLADLIRGLIQSDGMGPLSNEDDERLHFGIQAVMQLPPEDRWLEEVRSFLPVDVESAGGRLEKWCWGNEFGGVIDCPRDVVRLGARINCFDQTKILDNKHACGPALATLFHYCGKLLDGRRLIFVIDEFWKSLLEPAFAAVVADKLRTLRKLNSPMFLGTQSPRDALLSPIAHVIKEQCPSQFYFRNEKASWEDYGPEGFGLSMAEYEIVKSLPLQSGECLLKQGSVSVRVQMPMRGLVDELNILSGREANTKIFDEVLAELGAEMPPAALINRFQTRLREKVIA